ncbi:MAG: response regulator [Candidatus Omnitrophota bacterium]
MTIKDVTDYLKINRMTAYKLAKEGQLPAVKIAGEWRFDKTLIDNWLKEKFNIPRVLTEHLKEGEGKTVLIIDDEKDICDFFSYLLGQEGYCVEKATNGQKALNMVKEKRPDLILLDLKMPGMDGFEVLEELKKINGRIPIIILSDYGELDLSIKATRLGAHNCITKPFNLEKTKRAIEEAIETV